MPTSRPSIIPTNWRLGLIYQKRNSLFGPDDSVCLPEDTAFGYVRTGWVKVRYPLISGMVLEWASRKIPRGYFWRNRKRRRLAENACLLARRFRPPWWSLLLTAGLYLCVRLEISQVSVGSGLEQVTGALRLSSRGRDESVDDIILDMEFIEARDIWNLQLGCLGRPLLMME